MIAVQNLERAKAAIRIFSRAPRKRPSRFSLADGETKAVDIKLSKLVP